MNNEIKFEVGKTYFYRFITSYDTVVRCTILKRTAKSIVFEDDCGEKKTCRVNSYNGSEYINPCGRYSMSPTLWARNFSV